MLNSDQNHQPQHQLEVGIHRFNTFTASEVWERSALLHEFVGLFYDARIQAMLQESEMQVMEQGAFRWVSAISYYAHLGKLVEEYIQAHSNHWAGFRDATGVIEIEMFTRPFTDPLQCITRINLKTLGGWNDSPVKYGVRPVLV